MSSKSHKSNPLAEISTVFGMTLLLTLFGVFVYFMWSANKKSAEIKEQLSLDILFHENIDESLVKMMEKKLKAMDDVVINATYVSKNDARLWTHREIFPSKLIHIGGDEAPKFRWEHCSKCQKRMKEENLNNEHELQSYFIGRVANILSKKKRTIIY